MVGPDFSSSEVKLVQVAPGVYEVPLGEIESGAYGVRITQTQPGTTPLGRTVGLVAGEWLTSSGLSAADFTLFPEVALGRRIAQRNPGLGLAEGELLGPRLQAWAARMEALPVVQKTWPPHWRPSPET